MRIARNVLAFHETANTRVTPRQALPGWEIQSREQARAPPR